MNFWEQTPSPQTAHGFADTILCLHCRSKCHRSLDHRGVLRSRERGGQRIRSHRLAFHGGRSNALTIKAPRPEWLIAIERHDDRWNTGPHGSGGSAGATVMNCGGHMWK